MATSSTQRVAQEAGAIGIPPVKENVVGPAVRSVCGYEAKTRTDWRVTSDGDPAGQWT